MRLCYSVIICIVLLGRVESQTKRPRIYYLHVKSDVRYRFATTVVTSKVANSDSTARESTFDVTLPNEAFISNFTLTVGREVYVGNVTTKEEAKEVFERDRSLGKSAAIISAKPRETNTFNIRINVAANTKVTFQLRYEELLQRKLSAYNHVIFIKPGEPVADLSIEVDINESRNITNLRIPPIKSDLFTIKDQKEADAAITITRPSASSAHILFRPSLNTQTELGGSNGLDVHFKVKYDIDRNFDGGDLLMVNGYFVHFFAPSGLPPKPKDLVFVLDKSGSMRWRKLPQLKQAMSTILSAIQPEDRLNIITFSSTNHLWENNEQLVLATPNNIQRAMNYVQKTTAAGGTNIEGALERGIDLLTNRRNKTRAPVLVFLTDGKPTIRQRDPEKILKNVHIFNEDDIPIFSLAFGRNADYNFIKRLAAQNNGFGRKIYEDSDAAIQISDFYSEISAVLLQNVTFKYLPGSVVDGTLTRTVVPNMFQGTEIIVAGKMTDKMAYNIHPNVIATDLNGLVSLDVPTDGVVRLSPARNAEVFYVTEHIWAYLTIKQWIQQIDASTDKTEQEKLKQKTINMALLYNFVTPYTSMVVSLPDKLKSSPVDLLPDTPESVPPPFSGQGVRQISQMAATPRSLGGGIRSSLRRRKFGTFTGRLGSPISRRRRPSSTPVRQFNAKSVEFAPKVADFPAVAKVANVAADVGSNSNNMKHTTPHHGSTSGYILVGVKGIELPLCIQIPGQADVTKRYTLFRDKDTGTSVNIGFARSKGSTRITDLTIASATVIKLFPTHILQNGVRQHWTSNTFYTYVHGGQGSGVLLEVTSLNNNRLVVKMNFTDNSSQNIDGSLALPISGTLKVSPTLNTLPNNDIKELSLLTKKLGSIRQMTMPVERSSIMNCWVVRSTLPWMLTPIV
ncbi:inter-alpha-trypsin inhibitor heavy chain H3-like [Argopecten irradians]|uniref:inter-alpha-trypsin inhibitor heavy chain H3-like n=1 Tax=Argopecten irradians TaxID=31199 RepID=UPI0037236935